MIKRFRNSLKASLLLGGFFVLGCSNQPSRDAIQTEYLKVTGYAQGTTYTVIYSDSLSRDFSRSIDSLLVRFDSSLSTYKPNSIISQFNKSDTGLDVDMLFIRMIENSLFVYNLTDQSFDPSINPVLSYWGFNKELIENPDTIDPEKIEQLLSLKGFDKLIIKSGGVNYPIQQLVFSSYKGGGFLKKPAGLELNFNAIAQGLSVDLIAEFLRTLGVNHYMVEVGGESIVKGENQDGNPWRLGVDKPIVNTERKLQAIINLKNGAVATSGNYRKFYVKDGKKYAHTINPKTGYPAEQNLLSATVVAPSCWMADGLATACMVNGVEWSKSFASNNNEIEVFLIYDADGTAS
jgi:thiamine biosynthesis lipoprotein